MDSAPPSSGVDPLDAGPASIRMAEVMTRTMQIFLGPQPKRPLASRKV